MKEPQLSLITNQKRPRQDAGAMFVDLAKLVEHLKSKGSAAISTISRAQLGALTKRVS